VGKKAPYATKKNAGLSPIPHKRIAMGIKAIGGTGRKISKNGVIIILTNRNLAQQKPKTIAIKEPIT
jgi:hypothetical protein